MCQCSPALPSTSRSVGRFSLHDRGALEALRHKWIESEKAGRDLGDIAIRNWIRHHWNGFLRAKWLEHLEGRTYWIELEHDDFGLLQREFQDSRLIGDIMNHLKHGRENLDIILWARERGLNLDDVIDILEILDINSVRIESRLETRLTSHSQAG